MIKGVQKQIVQVQIPNNRYFESAYFILRPDLKDRCATQTEMTREANRILCESELLGGRRRSGRSRTEKWLFPFLGGVLAGGAAVSLIWIATLLFA